MSAAEAQGVLSVYWDTNEIGMFDERFVPSGQHHYSLSFPSATGNGAHVLGFRLDPFTNIQSSVTMTNIVIRQTGPSSPFTLSVTTKAINSSPVYQLNGEAGYDYEVQASTNLADGTWTNIAKLINTNGTLKFLIMIRPITVGDFTALLRPTIDS